MASDPVDTFLAAWHAAVEGKDARPLEPWMADGVQLLSPAFFRPKQGRAEVAALLSDVAASLSGYRVAKRWTDGNELLLEFDAKVGDLAVRGIDRISLDAAGRMTRLEVWVRPHRALRALMTAVADRQLRRMSLPARMLTRARVALRRGA